MTENSPSTASLPPLSSDMLIAAAGDLESAARWLDWGTEPGREPGLAAPLVLDLLDHVVPALRDLSTFGEHVGSSLRASLTTYDVFEDDETRDPAESIDQAEPELERARQLLHEAAAALSAAKKALSGQSHNGLREP
ncbi:hypothetical protein ACQHIV_42150 (plasmid) [Kribbella sp. GL6]|uniref:hypothetical protein n=1 Tax=Kribbella sp. GL6 TaxID=3419765 RepID=UPI003D08B70A